MHYEDAEACRSGETTTAGAPDAGEQACADAGGSNTAPDPDDCHLFYLCAPDGDGGYVAHQRECQEGLAFDPELHQ